MTLAVMLSVVLCYTLCALNDKYAVSRAGFDRNELMFLMSSGTVFFLTFILPFSDTEFTFSPKVLIPIFLITACKFIEFATLPPILQEMSPFQLKSWVGLTLFLSYFTDVVFYDTELSVPGLGFVALTFLGLGLAAGADRRSTDYKKLIFFLPVYVLSKYSYGLIMRTTSGILPNTLTLYAAMILLTVISFARIDRRVMLSKPEGRRGVIIVLAAKLPNALGLLGENYTAAHSLSNYSFIQPLILISLFVTALLSKKSKLPPLSIIGGAVTITGIVGFQLLK